MNKGSTGFFLFVWMALLGSSTVVTAGAQEKTVVRAMEIRGLFAFSTEEILRDFSTRVDAVYSPAQFDLDLEHLREKYVNVGYYYARVDSVHRQISSARVNLVAFFNEGKQSRIDTILFEGNSAIKIPRLRQNLAFSEGSEFVQSEIEVGAQAILKSYESAGFPFAKVAIDNVVMTEATQNFLVRFEYKITEGRQVRITELRVEGNTSTRNSVILREARLQGNENYTDQLAEKVRRRLERLQLFSSISLPELFLNQHEEGGLLVRVQEGNPNRFDGIVGYVPPPLPGKEGFVTGLVDLQFRNLFGTGRQLSARWHREDQYTQEIGLRYFEPWIASYPVNGEIGFVQRIQDSTYVRRRIDLAFDFSLNEEVTCGAVFSRTNVIPSESYGRTVLAESQETSAGLSVSYDTRNDPVTPVSGLYYRTEYDIGTKSITGSSYFTTSSDATQKILMDLEYYVGPFQNQIVATQLHINDFRSGLIEVSDLFRLGGARTLRGYREGQFLGSRLVWSNTEYRFMIAQRSFLFVFLDAGYIVTPEEPLVGLRASEQSKLGYGVGIRLDTRLGLIGVGIGLGEGDTFGTAKLHIQLVNAF